jgi:uncharacterized repeat protein (TIGR03803 family)
MKLVQGFDGNFYGTTTFGGANKKGTIFKMTPSGTLTVLHDFCSQSNCTDGEVPFSGLARDNQGNFYGTAAFGGIPDCQNGTGCGLIYKITPGGTFTILHSFVSTDGGLPEGPPLFATDGNLYGMTVAGGAYSSGTIYKMTTAGKLTSLYSFCAQANCPDGLWPTSGLIQGMDGNFYGATFGSDNLGGTAFRFTPPSTLTVLASFCSFNNPTCPYSANGIGPNALAESHNGVLYGTTFGGGAQGLGSAYKLSKTGKLTTLWSFTNGDDGSEPYSGLILSTDGTFYGTAYNGGTGAGVIYELSPSGVLTPIYDLFCQPDMFDCSDGSNPMGGLVEGTDGNLYGTSRSGGDNGGGTAFSVSLRFLRPFVETQPVLGKVGSPVTILGYHLDGVTSVTFNGTAATFKVVSDSEITTTVPAGATTGSVKVAKPTGTLISNGIFRVEK